MAVKYDWEGNYGYGPLEEAGINKQDVDIIRYRQGENDYASWWLMVRLADGRYAGVEAWCDYTGWDCQAGHEIVFGSSEKEVIFNCTAEYRRALGYEETPDCGV